MLHLLPDALPQCGSKTEPRSWETAARSSRNVAQGWRELNAGQVLGFWGSRCSASLEQVQIGKSMLLHVAYMRGSSETSPTMISKKFRPAKHIKSGSPPPGSVFEIVVELLSTLKTGSQFQTRMPGDRGCKGPTTQQHQQPAADCQELREGKGGGQRRQRPRRTMTLKWSSFHILGNS